MVAVCSCCHKSLTLRVGSIRANLCTGCANYFWWNGKRCEHTDDHPAPQFCEPDPYPHPKLETE